MYLLKEPVAKHNVISTSKIVCVCCCFYCCCVVFVVAVVWVVVLFDISTAISLNQIPSNAFYQKPKWFFFYGSAALRGLGLPRYRVSTITLIHKHTRYDSSGRTISPVHRPLPHSTHIHKRQTSMLPVGFEPTIPGKREAVDPLLRRRGYWDRLQVILNEVIPLCIDINIFN